MSLTSQLGRRKVYQDFVDNQRNQKGNSTGMCNMTFFQMLTYYGLSQFDPKSKSKLEEFAEIITIDTSTG